MRCTAHGGTAGKHHTGCILEFLRTSPINWDLMVCHPPCTYVCNSGSLRLYKDGKKANGPDVERWYQLEQAAEFIKALWTAPVRRICIENPIMLTHAQRLAGLPKHSQIIQPYEYGDDAAKSTCLWLKNLPPLVPTKRVPGRLVNGLERWSNQTDGGWNKLPPSADRGKLRAVTYQGIADAMAARWSAL